eukprot:Pgem_evm1s5458
MGFSNLFEKLEKVAMCDAYENELKKNIRTINGNTGDSFQSGFLGVYCTANFNDKVQFRNPYISITADAL